MYQNFMLPVPPVSIMAVGGTLLVTMAFLLVFPLRGGHGKHAGAGPGAVDVWQVQRNLRAEKARSSEIFRAFKEMQREERKLDPRARVRAAQLPTPYVGKHRNYFQDLVEVIHPRVPVFLEPAALRPH